MQQYTLLTWGAAVTSSTMTSELGGADDIENWLRDRTEIQRVATPQQIVHVPDYGSVLVLVVVAWVDQVSMFVVFPDHEVVHQDRYLYMRDDHAGEHPMAGMLGGGDRGRVIHNVSFQGGLPPSVRRIFLYSRSAVPGADPALPPPDFAVVDLT